MLRIATKKASSSEFSRARMGAVIANKGRILSTGINEVRHYKKCPTPRKWKNSLHAEQSAILKLLNSGRQHELVGATLFVSRVNNFNRPMLAKPCSFCEELISIVGIKRVFYTTGKGTKSYEPS